jgi:hypothetical protein
MRVIDARFYDLLLRRRFEDLILRKILFRNDDRDDERVDLTYMRSRFNVCI